VADAYASMTTAQLEADAAGRTSPVDLSSATTNAQRAELLRAADQAALPVGGGALGGLAGPQQQLAPHFEPGPPTPYSLGEEDLQARLAAAAGSSGAPAAGEPSGTE
jgi:hypothetical protein